MGGRLDATNAVDTDCALIVSIDLDHREWLGETREAIGREKAGIVRAGKPVIIGDRAVPDSVLELAAERARGAADRPRISIFAAHGDGWRQVDAMRPSGGRCCRCRRSAATSNSPTRRRARPSSTRSRRSCPSSTRRSRRESRVPICAAGWSGTTSTGVEWLFDVGHNPAAARRARQPRCVARLRQAARGSCSPPCATKISSGVVQPLVAASAAGWFVAQASADRGATGAELVDVAREPRRGARRTSRPTSPPRAAAARRAAAAPGDRVVVHGSFLTVGAAMEALRLYCAPSPLVDRPTTWTRV